MEKKLKNLFDYQKFEKNERLEKMLSETENRYAKELSDDELELINAAGEFEMDGGAISENTEGGESWYGINNQNQVFEPGSRFWIKWLNKNSPDNNDKGENT